MTENEAKAKLERTSILWGSATNTEIVEAVKISIKALEEIQQYRALGTVEELREAIEKQRAKKPRFYANNFYCSKCGNLVGNKEFGWQRFMYCDHCGNAIDWSEEE